MFNHVTMTLILPPGLTQLPSYSYCPLQVNIQCKSSLLRCYADGSRLCNSRSSDVQPQVEEQALWKRGGSVSPKVFGYTFDYDDKLAWANKHNIAPEETPYIRIQIARDEIVKRLPKGHRRLAVVQDDISEVLCLVIGHNKTEEELAKTKDPKILEMFQKVLGEERQPQWFLQI